MSCPKPIFTRDWIISYNLAKINKFINFPIIRNILGIMDGASRTTWRCKSILTVFSNDAVALEDLR
jgi:hypothetical protein